MERSCVKLIVLLLGRAESYVVRAQDGVLRGAVVDSATRAPLANASLTVRGLGGMQLSIDKPSGKVGQGKLLKPYHFLLENGDKTKMEGRTLSPVYLEEALSDVYYRKDPEKTKTVVLGKRNNEYFQVVSSRFYKAVYLSGSSGYCEIRDPVPGPF